MNRFYKLIGQNYETDETLAYFFLDCQFIFSCPFISAIKWKKMKKI